MEVFFITQISKMFLHKPKGASVLQQNEYRRQNKCCFPPLDFHVCL